MAVNFIFFFQDPREALILSLKREVGALQTENEHLRMTLHLNETQNMIRSESKSTNHEFLISLSSRQLSFSETSYQKRVKLREIIKTANVILYRKLNELEKIFIIFMIQIYKE